jgi:hypothetical protein
MINKEILTLYISYQNKSITTFNRKRQAHSKSLAMNSFLLNDYPKHV